MKILQVGNKLLEKVSAPVKDVNCDETKRVISLLKETANKNIKITAGLSAIQIGFPLRIFVYKSDQKQSTTAQNVNWKTVINPEILFSSKEKSMFWEGCLSVGEGKNCLFGPVSRPNIIRMKFITELNEKKIITAKNFLSHLLQHEIDHLNGILFLKYVSNPENLWKSSDLDKFIRKFGRTPEIIR